MVSLYELSVDNFDRALGATIGIVKKSEAHFLERGESLADIVSMKLAPDMLPFSFQINSVRHHSLHAVQGVLNGEFGPPDGLDELDFGGLIKLLEEAQTQLKAISADDVNARAGQPVIFKMGSMEIPFTAENFVQSFSLPNLYFHAATTYDMLRIKGAPLGKMDFMGRMNVGLPG